MRSGGALAPEAEQRWKQAHRVFLAIPRGYKYTAGEPIDSAEIPSGDEIVEGCADSSFHNRGYLRQGDGTSLCVAASDFWILGCISHFEFDHFQLPV